MVRLNWRILIYSHDTNFGLGHLRRCRTIAHSLVEIRSRAPVGADPVGLADHRQLRLPPAGRFRPRAGRHQAAQRRIHAAQPAYRHRADAAMRASIIRHTAEIFDPDLFIVDKEPLGLRGEVLPTLEMLKRAARRWCWACAT
jgi:predicted glycosyltransferase